MKLIHSNASGSLSDHFKDPAWRKLEDDINIIWRQIYSDVITGAESNQDCIELCIDANRIVTLSNAKDSENYMYQMIGRFGYEKVLRALDKRVVLF